MSEIDSSPESSKIPENWQFHGRGDPGLAVRQIDLDQRFIAFDLSKEPHVLTRKPLYGDYFFDNEGESLVKRLYFEEGVMVEIPSTFIDLVGDQEIDYRFDGEAEFDYSGRLPTRKGASVFFRERSLVDEKEAVLSDYSLGAVHYNGQWLDGIHFEQHFVREPIHKKLIQTPEMDLHTRRASKIEDWVLDPKVEENEESQDFWDNRYFKVFDNLRPQKIKNGAIYLDKNGDKIFLVDWKLEEDELDPSKGLFAVVSQTHIPSGIVKTLRAPLRMDMKKVKEAVFARPPYPKDEQGRLMVPWLNIHRIVGASLSYSYPPPSPKSS